jgi:transposase
MAWFTGTTFNFHPGFTELVRACVALKPTRLRQIRRGSAAKRFHQVLRREGGETLQDVLAAASTTLLANFTASLGRDSDAVQAALNLPWTTSPVEGQVSRIKTIKRTIYGRADFDLLRARVLQAA